MLDGGWEGAGEEVLRDERLRAFWGGAVAGERLQPCAGDFSPEYCSRQERAIDP